MSSSQAPPRTTPIAIGVAVAVIIALVALWWFSQASAQPGPDPRPSPSPSPTASPLPSPTASPGPTPDPQMPASLLLQLRNDDLAAVDNLLIGSKTVVSATGLLYVPGGLLVDAGPAGEMTLARTGLLSDTLASPRALSGLLGVRVSGALILERMAFAGLVDAVSGVWIRTSRGRVHLTGPEAADYVIKQRLGETESEDIERFAVVMNSVLERLPSDIDEMRQLVTSLGSLARSTIPTEDVVALLMSTREAVRSNRYNEQVLPTSVLRPGLDPVDVIAQPAALQMMAWMFPLTLLHPGESDPPRVLLQVAVTDAVEVLQARDAIVSTGYLCVGGSRVADQLLTLVRIPNGSEESRAVGLRVAEAMGLSYLQVVVGGLTNPTVDAEVVLGADWKAQ